MKICLVNYGKNDPCPAVEFCVQTAMTAGLFLFLFFPFSDDLQFKVLTEG